MCSGLLSLKVAALVSAGLAGLGAADFLRKVGEATTVAVERSLVSELAGNVSEARLREFEAALRPMYSALPKGADGHMGHQAVRYALHRLLLQRHGWFIVGLEPSAEALPPYLHGEWVPQYLQGILEERLGGSGINLHEIAALAATLEDLVHAESDGRVDRVYGILKLQSSGHINSEEADRLVQMYMMMYLDGSYFAVPRENLDEMVRYFKSEYPTWASVETWMREIKRRYLLRAGGSGLDRATVVHMVDELGKRFAAFNDRECRSLKAELQGMEGPRPGRVPLTDFYKKGLYSRWAFDEKKDYLRALGTLDESIPSQPSIIVPNYINSRPNCLAASSLYAVCCRNDCEDLMAHLELGIAAPTASPHRIQELVANLPANFSVAPPVLSETLVHRLQEIAHRHHGQVPLHGRLFSQWMHHAFPRECPYPHEGANPQTPDAWMKESEEEVLRILNEAELDSGSASGESTELPWTDTEVLLTTPSLRPVTAGDCLHALVIFVVLVVIFVGQGLLSMTQRGSTSRKGHNLDLDGMADVKPATGVAQKPWQVILLVFAVAFLLEEAGVLDATVFACALVGGLITVLVLLLVPRSLKPHHKKTDSYV